MAQVSLRINGYAYLLGCADGEEAHLRGLAADLDRRIDEIKASTGPSGEARLLLIAALMLADELHDLRGQPGRPDSGAKPAEKPDVKAARRLGRLAKRAEVIADQAEMPAIDVHAPAEAGPMAHADDGAHAENIAAPVEHS